MPSSPSLTGWAILRGRSFLDIGSGSGLFSLAARNLGASVRSFDYDLQSVACTTELRRRFHPDDPDWIVEQGSALDEPYLRSLGTFDVVYSWGVLHHTGDMWRALDLATIPVAPKGGLYLSLYNRVPDFQHRVVCTMKRTYVAAPTPIRHAMVVGYGAFEVAGLLAGRRWPPSHIREYARTSRGMSWWTDIRDWVGGYPYESATPDQVTTFYRDRGLLATRVFASPGHGCNEFLLSRAV